MKRFLRADPCCRSVIKEFAHAFSCAYIELWMHAKHEQIHNYMIGKIILIQIHISSVWFIPIYEENFF